jgi:Zn-dependent protease with chaperone function
MLSLRLISVALVLSSLVASADVGEDRVVAGPPRTEPICDLSLLLGRQEGAYVTLTLVLGEEVALPIEPFTAALNRLLPAPLRNVRQQPFPVGLQIHGTMDDSTLAVEGGTAGTLDLMPLIELLRPLQVPQVDVQVTSLAGRFSTARRWDGQRRFKVSTDEPHPVHFAFAGPPSAGAFPYVELLPFVLLPVGLLLWCRRTALRAPDPAAGWYSFWRRSHWINLGTWLCWFTAVSALRGDEEPYSMLPALTSEWVLTLLPPWLLLALGNHLALEVQGRSSGAPVPPRTLVIRLAVNVCVTIAPCIMVLAGFLAIGESGLRTGVAWLLAALVVHLLGNALALETAHAVVHTLRRGPLHERIFELARAAGVSLQKASIVPADNVRQPNAFAVPGTSMLLTEALLTQLDRDEVDAVVAHELGHLRRRHLGWRLAFSLAALGAPSVLWPLLPADWQQGWLQHVPLGPVAGVLVFYLVSRHFEFVADRYSACLVDAPEALIKGLLKIQRASLLPLRWGRLEEMLLTHPSMSRRIGALARHNRVKAERLQQLVDAPDDVGARYPVPPALREKDLIFSPAFKARSVNRIGLAILATAVLAPAVAAALVDRLDLEGPNRYCALGLGAALSILVLLWTLNYSPLWGYIGVRPRLRQKLRDEGIDPESLGGIFVSLAPDASPRLYDGYTNWDFGFLFFGPDRLIYLGERARFALRREQVLSIRLAPGLARWWGGPNLYVGWEDAEQTLGGTFNLRPADARSLRQLSHATRDLGLQLRRWRESGAATSELPSSADLALPCFGPVDSQSPRQGGLLTQATIAFFAGAGLSVLLGLSFDSADGGIGWFAPAAACLSVWFIRLPQWWRRLLAPPTGA